MKYFFNLSGAQQYDGACSGEAVVFLIPRSPA